MIRFSELREQKESQRKAILNRGEKKEVHVQEDVLEHEVTSVIDMLRKLNEDTAGRLVIVEEGQENKEIFIDYETSNYLLTIFESLDPDKQSLFEQTLIENIDNLDEIALYCESLVELEHDDEN